MPPIEERAACVVLPPPGAKPDEALLHHLRTGGCTIQVERDTYGAMAGLGRLARVEGDGRSAFDRIRLILVGPTDPRLLLALERYLPAVEILRWDGVELDWAASGVAPTTPGPSDPPELRLSGQDEGWLAPVPPLDEDDAPLDSHLTREEIEMLLATEPPES